LVFAVLEISVFAVIFFAAWLASRASRSNCSSAGARGFLPIPLGIGYSLGLRLAIAMLMMFVIAFLVATGIMSLGNIQSFALKNRPDVAAIVDVSALKKDPLTSGFSVTS